MNGAPSTLVSPGLYGFLAFFLLGLALYLLMRNMNARMRRMSYRSEELAREAEQEQAADRARKQGRVAPDQRRDEAPEGAADGTTGRERDGSGGDDPTARGDSTV